MDKHHLETMSDPSLIMTLLKNFGSFGIRTIYQIVKSISRHPRESRFSDFYGMQKRKPSILAFHVSICSFYLVGMELSLVNDGSHDDNIFHLACMSSSLNRAKYSKLVLGKITHYKN